MVLLVEWYAPAADDFFLQHAVLHCFLVQLEPRLNAQHVIVYHQVLRVLKSLDMVRSMMIDGFGFSFVYYFVFVCHLTIFLDGCWLCNSPLFQHLLLDILVSEEVDSELVLELKKLFDLLLNRRLRIVQNEVIILKALWQVVLP